MNLKKSIRIALARKDMNQGDLAAAIGMTAPSLSQLINRDSMSSVRINQIATVFNMKASELLALGEE